MTFLEKTQTECRAQLEKSNTQNCLKQLKTALSQNTPLRQDLTLILANYNALLRGEQLLDPTEYRREMAKTAKSISTFIEQLEDTDVSEGVFIETLLIICNPDKRTDKEAFFGKKYFPNAEFINYGEVLPKGIYDVVILEDEDNWISQCVKNEEGKLTQTPANSQRQQDMKNYLQATDAYFIYSGPGRFDMPDYNHRVYFSNSRFSIYARLKELLDYIKYYGK
jgi:hypothetical protein